MQLNSDDWQLVFQSRFGREAWLQPYCSQTLETLGRSDCASVDIVCPGFSADCLETLEEIEEENREIYTEAGGGGYRYIPALNNRDDHIDLLTTLVVRHTEGGWCRIEYQIEPVAIFLLKVFGVSRRIPRHGRGVAQPGRALPSGGRGRRFKSCLPDQFILMRVPALQITTAYTTGLRGQLMHTTLRTILILPLTILLAACGVNSIPALDEEVKASWSQVENQYQRRADLIPNLVSTVKGYAAQEKTPSPPSSKPAPKLAQSRSTVTCWITPAAATV